MKRIPIGISDFREIIENNYYYIDKSLFIKEIIDDGFKVLLLTRPRRFGKTINMSMLKYYFEKNNEDFLSLFSELNISKQGNIYKEKQGKYPVIFITLKDIKNSNWDKTYSKIKKCIEKEYDRHYYLYNSDKLTYIERETFNRIREGKASYSEYEYSLAYLSEYLDKYYGTAPILLIDEYDVPIQSGYVNDFYDEIIEFIRNWLSGGIKDNRHITFCVMTGILRIGKESIFSGMNNLKVRTILDNQYSEYFGFTEKEIIKILKYYNIEYKIELIKEWYNGYIFGDKEIYNPWSIVNFIDNKDKKPQAYWLNTSSNDTIKDIIKNSDNDTKEEILELIKGNIIEEIIDTNIIYPDIYRNNNLFSLFLLSGYLKATNVIQNEFGFMVAKLKIPNKEIRTVYRQEILTQISDKINTMEQMKMLNSLLKGDVKTFERLFNNLLIKTISFYDTKENFYHGFMLGITTLLIDNYIIKSNRESGYGRFDLVLIPRDKDKVAVNMEFKVTDNEQELVKESKNALDQIENMKYDTDIYDLGIKKIYKYGISFKGKKFHILKK